MYTTDLGRELLIKDPHPSILPINSVSWELALDKHLFCLQRFSSALSPQPQPPPRIQSLSRKSGRDRQETKCYSQINNFLETTFQLQCRERLCVTGWEWLKFAKTDTMPESKSHCKGTIPSFDLLSIVKFRRSGPQRFASVPRIGMRVCHAAYEDRPCLDTMHHYLKRTVFEQTRRKWQCHEGRIPTFRVVKNEGGDRGESGDIILNQVYEVNIFWIIDHTWILVGRSEISEHFGTDFIRTISERLFGLRSRYFKIFPVFEQRKSQKH